MRLRSLAVLAVILLLTTLAVAQANPALFNVKKVFVEKMQNNLDQYITSEISKQFHGSLAVVLDVEEWPFRADGRGVP